MQTITLNMHTVKKGICLCNKKYVNKTRHAYKPEELNTLSWVSAMQTITLNMHTVKKGICLCNKKYVNKTRHAYKPEELNTLSWVSCPLCELAKTCEDTPRL